MQCMDEIKRLALELFEIEKKYLLADKQEYSCAIVVVVTPKRRYYEEVAFDSVAQKDAVYGAIVERAKTENAIAIITINTARWKDVADESELDSYCWGQLAAEDRHRCLSLTLSGPGIESLSLGLQFSVKNGELVLGKQTDFEPTIVNSLPNWP
jgi:hypothetical protein